MHTRRFLSLLIAATLLLAAPAAAQIGQGRLTGTVKDAQGAVLPGVTVTATSPALIGAQTVVTEANGSTGSRRCRRAPTRWSSSCRDSRRSSARTSSWRWARR